ncbi:hypothetical protein RPMA_15320 [Tardiphaga alba]|uniref:HNH endonuclease n=1 Tax=Tardiphaga alba TaxID=340268 RepID=A0ABX8ACB5_9BRAD|nr:hypothetical protein [Tardiphaga alba]QUS40045.1 hypothetical protein RPMA_15320 [Tardiphaga alba]
MSDNGRDRNIRLFGLWHEQNGACFYCDGPTFIPERENKDAARVRLRIEAGVSGSGRHLNQHVATIDKAAKAMACKFCNCSRGSRDAGKHRTAMQTLVAAERHPVNRLIESYDDCRLAWTTCVSQTALAGRRAVHVAYADAGPDPSVEILRADQL